MHHYKNNITIFAFLLFTTVTIGCGGGAVSDHKPPTSTNVPTAKEEVASWLKGVAESGEIDSGAELMKAAVDKLKQAGVKNVDAIQKDMTALISTKESSAIKTKANALLKKLE